jgi:hypothetical protein
MWNSDSQSHVGAYFTKFGRNNYNFIAVGWYFKVISKKLLFISFHHGLLLCLLDEIYSLTSTADSSINFLQQRGILKSSMTCLTYFTAMVLTPGPAPPRSRKTALSGTAPPALSEVNQCHNGKRTLWSQGSPSDHEILPVVDLLPKLQGSRQRSDHPNHQHLGEHH